MAHGISVVGSKLSTHAPAPSWRPLAPLSCATASEFGQAAPIHLSPITTANPHTLRPQSATPALTEDNSAADVSIHAEGEDGTATQQARENVKKAESVVAAAREAAARPAQATRTFLLIGFGAGPERLSELAAAGVPVNGAVRLRVGDADESDPADPSTPAGMWEGLVQKQTEDADLILLDVPAGSQCPAVFTKSAPRGKPPTEEGVDPPAGWKELAGALITTSNAAAEYRAWKERATVYDVPDAAPAEEVDMELYRSLVSTVPEVRCLGHVEVDLPVRKICGLVECVHALERCGTSQGQRAVWRREVEAYRGCV